MGRNADGTLSLDSDNEETPDPGGQGPIIDDAAAQSIVQAILAGNQPGGGTTSNRADVPDSITGEDWADLGIPTLPQDDTYLWREGMGPTGSDRDAAGDSSYFKRAPRYTQEFPMQFLNGMSTWELAALEVKMQQAGYYDDDDKSIGLGKRSTGLIRHFTALVNEADQNRVKWDQQLNENIRRHAEGLDEEDDGYGPFIAPVYLKPDYDTLAQRAKGSIRTGLGRDPTSGEMELLTQFLGTAHKDQWKAREYNTALADHNQRSRAHETGEDQGSPTVQDSDMIASYDEMFESRYENELEHRERVDQTRTQSASLFGSLDMMSRSV